MFVVLIRSSRTVCCHLISFVHLWKPFVEPPAQRGPVRPSALLAAAHLPGVDDFWNCPTAQVYKLEQHTETGLADCGHKCLLGWALKLPSDRGRPSQPVSS